VEAEEVQGWLSMFFFLWKYGVFGQPRSTQCGSSLYCTVSNTYKEIWNTHDDSHTLSKTQLLPGQESYRAPDPTSMQKQRFTWLASHLTPSQ